MVIDDFFQLMCFSGGNITSKFIEKNVNCTSATKDKIILLTDITFLLLRKKTCYTVRDACSNIHHSTCLHLSNCIINLITLSRSKIKNR